ncbi:hypothetical protein D3C78_1023260 [compost metagenome]
MARFHVQNVAGEAVHARQRVDRDLLGVLLGVLDLLKDLIVVYLGHEHLVLGLLTASDARFHEFGRRGLQHLRVFVADHRRGQDTVGTGDRVDVTQHGHFVPDTVARAFLLEDQHVRVAERELAATGHGLLQETQAFFFRLTGHAVQKESVLAKVAFQQVEISNVFFLRKYKRVFHRSCP